MNPQPIKIKYLQCHKGGYHEGQQLNTVCLLPQCKLNALCCCACVDEFHKGHQTTTLKKLLIDANNKADQIQSITKEQVKPTSSYNTDIISTLIDSSKKQALESFQHLSGDIKQTLQKIQTALNTYYENLQNQIQKPNHNNDNPSAKIFQSIETIQGSSTIVSLLPALQQLLSTLEQVNNKMFTGDFQSQPSQESFINLIEHSNKRVFDVASSRLIEINQKIVKGLDIVTQSIEGLNTLLTEDIFSFSTELKSLDIWLKSSQSIVSKKGQQYQVSLMEPCITKPISSFKFKVTQNNKNWIAFGLCHKNIVQNNKFSFDYKNCGHGCYMISSNGGIWSHKNEQLNNKVRAFTFIEGDIINCIVNQQMKSIFFIKETYSLFDEKDRQIFEHPYIEIENDQLHPCVVFYFENDSVEYIPAMNLSTIPKYEYLFSEKFYHPRLKIIGNKTVKALEGANQYRAAICSNSLQNNLSHQPKKFSFKILKSSSNWIGVGMCHRSTAANSQYTFHYLSLPHSYYMISSNGGSWSTIDTNKNNIVRAFKFGAGDVINCEVFFVKDSDDAGNKIIFKKGAQVYQLNFKPIQGNQLYPCVMLYYSTDEVSILPIF